MQVGPERATSAAGRCAGRARRARSGGMGSSGPRRSGGDWRRGRSAGGARRGRGCGAGGRGGAGVLILVSGGRSRGARARPAERGSAAGTNDSAGSAFPKEATAREARTTSAASRPACEARTTGVASRPATTTPLGFILAAGKRATSAAAARSAGRAAAGRRRGGAAGCFAAAAGAAKHLQRWKTLGKP
eukprot:gene9636-biopygen4653